MDSWELLVFLIIVILSLLEGARGRARRERPSGRPERPRRPGEAPGAPGEAAGPGPAPPSRTPSREPAATSAEVLVPAELWEQITGRRREEARDALPEAITLEEVGPEDEHAQTLEVPARKVETLEVESGELEAVEPAREETGRGTRPAEMGEGRGRAAASRRTERAAAPRARAARPTRPARPARGPAASARITTRPPVAKEAAPAVAVADEEAEAEARHRLLHERLGVLPPPAAVAGRGRVRAGTPTLPLEGPDELRRAMVLKEILDPPLALRPPSDLPA